MKHLADRCVLSCPCAKYWTLRRKRWCGSHRLGYGRRVRRIQSEHRLDALQSETWVTCPFGDLPARNTRLGCCLADQVRGDVMASELVECGARGRDRST